MQLQPIESSSKVTMTPIANASYVWEPYLVWRSHHDDQICCASLNARTEYTKLLQFSECLSTFARVSLHLVSVNFGHVSPIRPLAADLIKEAAVTRLSFVFGPHCLLHESKVLLHFIA